MQGIWGEGVSWKLCAEAPENVGLVLVLLREVGAPTLRLEYAIGYKEDGEWEIGDETVKPDDIYQPMFYRTLPELPTIS